MIATVVPVKPATGAKRRLAPVLTDTERTALARRLLTRTVTVAAGLGPVVVVSRSARMRARARRAGATTLVEDGEDLDTAVAQGLARLTADGWDRALVLPADLPHLRLVDLDGLLAAARGAGDPDAVVVPCQREEGTNALLLRPPAVLAPAFGPGSFARHVDRARAAGLQVAVHRSPGFGDLDVPADWADAPELHGPVTRAGKTATG